MSRKYVYRFNGYCLRAATSVFSFLTNGVYPISLDMLLLLPRHLRYGECEGGFAVCVAGVAYPYEPSLREVGGSIFGILQAGCWCKKAEKDVPLAI